MFEIADRITVLRDGQLIDTVRKETVDQKALIRMMVGRPVEEIYPGRPHGRGRRSCAWTDSAREGEFRDVSFSLARGEVLGMFGLVGSGRTAVARSIFGGGAADLGERFPGREPGAPEIPPGRGAGGASPS